MTFEEILDQAVAMLQRRGRVAYIALKRQFDLDSAYLEDLKEALLFAHPVVDENGHGLVWSGDPATPEVNHGYWRASEGRFQTSLLAVIMLLQRDRRVTYRTLKNAFGIEGAVLTEIRKELRLRRLAIDEEGEVLVWTGETPSRVQPREVTPSQQHIAAAISPASPSSQLDVSAQEPRRDDHPASTQEASESSSDEQFATLEPVRSAPEAERRHLTVMFGDLVGSTKLSSQLDPEDYRGVVREYQKVCSEAIQPFDGHVAQLLGDGLLAYFGYSVAHEEDAQRAMHTGLGIVEAIGVRNTRLSGHFSPQQFA